MSHETRQGHDIPVLFSSLSTKSQPTEHFHARGDGIIIEVELRVMHLDHRILAFRDHAQGEKAGWHFVAVERKVQIFL